MDVVWVKVPWRKHRMRGLLVEAIDRRDGAVVWVDGRLRTVNADAISRPLKGDQARIARARLEVEYYNYLKLSSGLAPRKTREASRRQASLSDDVIQIKAKARGRRR